MPPGDETWRERYVKGDVTMSLIQTARGRVIHLVHGVSNPHPYSRLNHLAGTKGVFEDYPPRIYLEPAQSNDEWGSFDDYADVRPLAVDRRRSRPRRPRRHGLHHAVAPGADAAAGPAAGHRRVRLGGVERAVPAVRAVGQRNSQSVEFPDFTRGHWQTPHPGTDSAKPV